MNQVDMDKSLAYTVLQPFKTHTPMSPRALKVGDVVTLPETVALVLINQGKIWPAGMAMLEIFSNYLQVNTFIVCISGDRRTSLPEGDAVKAIYDLSGKDLKNKPQENLKVVDKAKRALPSGQAIKKRRK